MQKHLIQLALLLGIGIVLVTIYFVLQAKQVSPATTPAESPALGQGRLEKFL